jgi:hypothetical protein
MSKERRLEITCHTNLPSFFAKKLKFKIIFALITQIIFHDFVAASGGCSDIEASKNKMNSVLRAYQCSKATSVDECKNFLGLGEYGQAAIAALAAGAIGKKVVSQMRPDHFVLCPLNFKTSQIKRQNQQSLWAWQLILGYQAWSACFQQEPLIQRNLFWGVHGDINTLDGKIKAAQTNLENLKKQQETKKAKAPDVDPGQIDEARSKLAQAQQRIEDLQKEMSADKDVPRIGSSLKKRYPDVEQKFKNLILPASSADANLDELKSQLYTSMKNAGMSEAEMQESLTPLAKRLKTLNAIGKQKQKINGFEADLEQYNAVQSNSASTASSASANVDSDNIIDMDKKLGDSEQLLQTLQDKKQELEKIKDQLALSKPLSADQLTEAAHRIYNSEAFGNETALHLRTAGGVLEEMERKTKHAAINTARSQGRSVPFKAPAIEKGKIRPSLSIKSTIAKSVLGFAATAVGMEAASAANFEKPLIMAMDAADPTAIFHMEDLGGSNCGDMVPSILITRNPEKGCGFDMEFNAKTYESFLKAEGADLAALYQDPGVCQFIQYNYDRYYPRSTMKPINCVSSNIVVDFNNHSSINVGSDSIRFTPPDQETSIKYTLGSGSVPERFAFVGQRERQNLSAKDAREKFPEQFDYVNNLRAAALEIDSCCHPEKGPMPSESDCGRYGISVFDANSANPQNKLLNSGKNSR